MITKERLMELLVQAGSEIGILPKRMPEGWVRFAELVEAEALKVRGINDNEAGRSAPGAATERHQPTNVEDAANGNVNAIRHIAYGEGWRDGKAFAFAKAFALAEAVKDYGGAPGGGKSESHQFGEFVKLHPWVSVALDNPQVFWAFRAWRETK